MRNTNNMKDTNKYSSYWIGSDLFDDDDDIIVDKHAKKSNDLMALASYKRAIGNFVNIVTNDNIKVKFDERGDSYTDGKTVTISAKMDSKDFDSTVGLALHEGSHIKLTDFSTLADLRGCSNLPSPITFEYLDGLSDKHLMTFDGVRNWASSIIKDLVNVIEDRRIDYYIYSTSPGYKGYYHAMYDKYFNAKIIDKGLISSEYRTNDWESYMFRIINITNANRDLDALPMLREVYKMIDLNNISRLENTRQVLQLACDIFKTIEDTLPQIGNQNQPNQQSGDGESGDDQSEGSGSGAGGGDNSETNGTDNTEGAGGEAKDGSNGTDDTKGDAEGDDVKSGRPSYNPNGAGGVGNSEIADNPVTPGDGELNDRQKKQLDSAIEKQKKFQNGDITKKKVSKTEQQKLETLSTAGIDEKTAGKDYTGNSYWRPNRTTQVVIVRNFTKGLADSDTIDMLSTYSYRVDRNMEAIKKGVQIGTMLGRKLKLRSEERSLVTPRMKNGKISGRLLHELGMGNVSIFDQTVVNKHNPALVHISIDASSSMGGEKWTNAQISAVAIAKAASMTSNLDVVISYRAIQGHQNSTIQPLMFIAYDSRKDKFSKITQLFGYLNPNGTTPEGLCYEAVLDEIVKTNKGTDSYFINFSDGEPGFQNSDMEYYGDAAVVHTSNQIKKMTMAGVKVLSYFICGNYINSSSADNFKRMYGKHAEMVNVASLIPLTRTLNKLFQ
jgi:hypothetical protein